MKSTWKAETKHRCGSNGQIALIGPAAVLCCATRRSLSGEQTEGQRELKVGEEGGRKEAISEEREDEGERGEEKWERREEEAAESRCCLLDELR